MAQQFTEEKSRRPDEAGGEAVRDGEKAHGSFVHVLDALPEWMRCGCRPGYCRLGTWAWCSARRGAMELGCPVTINGKWRCNSTIHIERTGHEISRLHCRGNPAWAVAHGLDKRNAGQPVHSSPRDFLQCDRLGHSAFLCSACSRNGPGGTAESAGSNPLGSSHTHCVCAGEPGATEAPSEYWLAGFNCSLPRPSDALDWYWPYAEARRAGLAIIWSRSRVVLRISAPGFGFVGAVLVFQRGSQQRCGLRDLSSHVAVEHSAGSHQLARRVFHCGNGALDDNKGDSREGFHLAGLRLVLIDRGREFALATINGLEVVQQRLDGLHAGVLAVRVCNLSRQRLGYPGFIGDGFPPTRASLFQPTLEIFNDGFHGCR